MYCKKAAGLGFLWHRCTAPFREDLSARNVLLPFNIFQPKPVQEIYRVVFLTVCTQLILNAFIWTTQSWQTICYDFIIGIALQWYMIHLSWWTHALQWSSFLAGGTKWLVCWTLTRIALSQSYCWDRIWFGIEHSGRNPLLVICVAAVGQVKQGLVTRVAAAEGRSWGRRSRAGWRACWPYSFSPTFQICTYSVNTFTILLEIKWYGDLLGKQICSPLSVWELQPERGG